MTDPGDLEPAVRRGLARAALHLGKAGRELVSAVGAFLDEVVRVKRDPPDDSGAGGEPTRIEVE